MRQTTQGLVLVAMALGLRWYYTQSWFAALAVPLLAVWHESFVTYMGKGFNLNLYILFLWAIQPYVYMVVMCCYVLLYTTRDKSFVVKSREGDNMVVKHSVPLIPDSVTNHSAWDIFAGCKVQLFGCEMETTFVGTVDVSQPIMDENSAIQDIKFCNEKSSEVWTTSRNILIGTTLLIFVALGGWEGAAVGVVLTLTLAPRMDACIPRGNDTPIQPKIISMGKPIDANDGIYKISVRVFDYPYHMGIGYLDKGVFHTRLHVTKANPVVFGEVVYKPSYVNGPKDSVAYGGSPRISRVADREEVVVALAGKHGNGIVKYRSRATLDENGNISFYGNRSTPGTSGSPVFRKIRVEERTNDDIREVEQYVLVGTTGWFYDKSLVDANSVPDDRRSVEIVPSDPTISGYTVQPANKNITQVISHPGSGKTRTQGVEIVRDGVHKYGKAYFSGPSLTVCTEAYNILNEHFPGQVALYTSTAEGQQRGSAMRSIIVAAHATFLSMISSGSQDVTKQGLWVLDESHTIDSKSMVLKDYLRHMVTNLRKGALVEMSATAYDIRVKDYVYSDGSNYPITDHEVLNEEHMAHLIISTCKDFKSLVFVQSMTGPARSRRGPNYGNAEYLANEISKAGGKFITLSRKNFATNYVKAVEMQKGVILSTDICECGANIHPDTVYDYQSTYKMVMSRNNVYLDLRTIDMAQKVQRRGRVGRRPGQASYIYIPRKLEPTDVNRVEHQDRLLVSRALGIEILDPKPREMCYDIQLTPEQVSVWASGGIDGIESPYLIHMITGANGRLLPNDLIDQNIKVWKDCDNVAVPSNLTKSGCSVGWWDARDHDKLVKFLVRAGIPVEGCKKPDIGSWTTTLSKWVGSTRSRSVLNALGDIAENDDDGEDTPTNEEEDREPNYLEDD